MTDAEERASRLAEQVFQTIDDAHGRSLEAQTQSAVVTLQILSVAAGGGIAADAGVRLGELGRSRGEAGAIASINCALALMFASLVASVLTGVVAYASQAAYTASVARQVKTSKHPFRQETSKSNKLRKRGTFLEWCTIAFGLGSLVLLCIGAVYFYRIVGPTSASV